MTTGYKVRQPGGGDNYYSDHSICGGQGGHGLHGGHSGHGGHDDPDEYSLHGSHDVQLISIFTFIECFQRLRAW